MAGPIARGDPSSRARAAGQLGMGLSHHESSIFALERGIKVKSYEQVREFACYGMGVLKNEDGLSELSEALEDNNISVREAAAISYGAMRPGKASKALTDMAESDANFGVRRIASISLILIGDVKGFEHLMESFKGRGDSAVREMGYVELTELSNMYIPLGFKIDDYMQEGVVSENPDAPMPPGNP
ncbi:MAG: HEAT repeat domain-containing protein [Planctomycetota bacterium]|nr:HEAT repeat domain-containing protein [Planctomycetota bacterium]